MSVKRILPFFYGLGFIFFFSACEEPGGIGDGLVPRNSVGVFFTDTLSLRVSTVLGEVTTSQTNTLLAGTYQDPSLGTVVAKSFFQLGTDTLLLSQSTDESPVYDSLTIFFPFQYSYANTESIQRFGLHLINDGVGFQEDSTYTNQSSLAFDPTPFISFEVSAETIEEDGGLRIRLPDSFGQELFALAERNATLDEYDAFFQGFALVPDSTFNPDGTIIGFTSFQDFFSSNTTLMELHYTEPISDTTTADRSLFFATSFGQRFNQITSNRSSTLINELDQTFEAISTDLTNNTAFVQAGIGLQTKIEIPYLNRLKELGNISINRAELVIKVNAGSTDEFSEPNNLVLFESNSENQILVNEDSVQLLIQQDGFFNAVTRPLILSYDSRFEEYRGFVSDYLNLTLNGEKSNDAILLTALNNSTTLNRLLVNASPNSSFGSQLRIFYTVFE